MKSPVGLQASKRVLVADDDPLSLRVAARLLRQLGHSGALVSDGQKALELLDKQQFDLLLLDLSMPVLDGLGTLAALRERERQGRRGLPVVLATGHDLSAEWAFYQQAGASAYVLKPLALDALAEVLQRL